MQRAILFPIFFLLILVTNGCFGGGGGNSPSGSVTREEKEAVSDKLSLAMGGVAEGHDVVSLGESPNSLDYTTEDVDLLSIAVPEGSQNYLEAKAVQVSAKQEGIGYITPVVNLRSRDPIQVTIPPQKLIQVLVGEARGQMAREAILDEEEVVKTTSLSLTGRALGAVIRNRIEMINETDSPGLFKADPALYESNPPVSYYAAVIEAPDQFNPVNPTDPTHEKYLEAANRTTIQDDDDLVAYDQAVLTAADIFNEEAEDPTGGAFAFYSPDEEETAALEDALTAGALELPAGAGTSDARFPSLAPVQVLILPGIASATTRDDRPSFVFVRERNKTEAAVTDVP